MQIRRAAAKAHTHPSWEIKSVYVARDFGRLPINIEAKNLFSNVCAQNDAKQSFNWF